MRNFFLDISDWFDIFYIQLQVFIAIGILLCYVMGRSLEWNWLALASCVFLVPFTFGLYFIPEVRLNVITYKIVDKYDEDEILVNANKINERRREHC